MFPTFKRMFAQSKRNGTILITISGTVATFTLFIFWIDYFVLEGQPILGNRVPFDQIRLPGISDFFIIFVKWVTPLYLIVSFFANLREEKRESVQTSELNVVQKINWKPKIIVGVLSVLFFGGMAAIETMNFSKERNKVETLPVMTSISVHSGDVIKSPLVIRGFTGSKPPFPDAVLYDTTGKEIARGVLIDMDPFTKGLSGGITHGIKATLEFAVPPNVESGILEIFGNRLPVLFKEGVKIPK